ncbi:MAG TPA: phosphate signaling complex protein PhoU [Dehalococcoidia bacterium]|jgi:phosphate transport system protein|nr:phosphate transport system regulatory protein PhoU [Chloroflexota bacterium]MDP6055946.1 phosphate signaling complex protein PhoU [Dehalococcoidia bacterium]MDP7261975.1 phosphate signaling complex protein PhoU [Dehalococcoidia bacterium]MDP7485077.1 phosphate signaling complex protein PhoU [Dehalococcoidia bacterium]HJP27439.1 phosphate signaling complex protein PhoU [Dehalococcoidia bacterium]|tara:strand:- start:1364 stop:2080 length:717 start_codon:yes stop_codon:yes gene_type:complete
MNEQDSIIATGRQEFDRELGRLETELILMSGFVEKAIFDALQALKNRDIDRSQRVIDEDDHIDETELEIERYCVELIRRQSPMAGDLRRIVASLQIAGELERIGDYAEGIAKISIMMGNQPPLKELIDIPRMGDMAVSMLKRALEAFMSSDAGNVRTISVDLEKEDDEVDDLYTKVQTDLMELVKSNPDNAERATYLMWVAHNVERVADRAMNIAERALYQATGELVSGNTQIEISPE